MLPVHPPPTACNHLSFLLSEQPDDCDDCIAHAQAQESLTHEPAGRSEGGPIHHVASGGA